VQRAVLMSFNNKPASDAVPGGVPDGVRHFEDLADDLVNVVRGFESRWGFSILFVF
jgi:hypothetical protein